MTASHRFLPMMIVSASARPGSSVRPRANPLVATFGPFCNRMNSFIIGKIFRWWAALSVALPGCAFYGGDCTLDDLRDHYAHIAGEIQYPTAEDASNPQLYPPPPPLTIYDSSPPASWNLSLHEAVQTTLANSKVMRDLGGVLLQAPEIVKTVYDPAIEETNPRFGIEAALSEFDTQYTTEAFFVRNDRAINNILLAGGARLLEQHIIDYQAQLAKTTATGTEFFMRHLSDYDASNAPGNLFPSAFTTIFEAEVRQPLFQRAGTQFNRIAGPRAIPGVYTGVEIARVNTDISLHEFEVSLRDLVSNVENSYWELYFAYRDLDTKISARDAALETWRSVQALYLAGRRGGEAEKEAQAREQYFRFEEDVQNALSGRLLEGTRTNNGSRGGTFRGTGGVQVAERRLRLLMAIPISDGRLIRPSDKPIVARVVFDWYQIVAEALQRRAELRRQKTVVKRQELELIASRNFLMPQVDTVGLYRWRGFGKYLIDPNSTNKPRFNNAWQDLISGDFQEWELGVELAVPLGFRRGHAAVRNSQLLLARTRAVLREQERQVMHDLSDAVANKDRAYVVAQTAFNRRVAATQELAAAQVAYDADRVPIDLVLDAQQRLADADIGYYRALAEHTLAIKNVHFEKGSLLSYNGIYLAETPWLTSVCRDAAARTSCDGQEPPISYVFSTTKQHEKAACQPVQKRTDKMKAPSIIEVPTKESRISDQTNISLSPTVEGTAKPIITAPAGKSASLPKKINNLARR